MNINFKDIFKPRYAIVVGIIESPDTNGIKMIRDTVAVTRLPFKRPLDMSFNDFENGLNGIYKKELVFFGSYITMRNIYGIGSTLKHNIKNAILFTK